MHFSLAHDLLCLGLDQPDFQLGSISTRSTQSDCGCTFTRQGVAGKLDSTPRGCAEDIEDSMGLQQEMSSRKVKHLTTQVGPEGRTRIAGFGCTSSLRPDLLSKKEKFGTHIQTD